MTWSGKVADVAGTVLAWEARRDPSPVVAVVRLRVTPGWRVDVQATSMMGSTAVSVIARTVTAHIAGSPGLPLPSVEPEPTSKLRQGLAQVPVSHIETGPSVSAVL